MAVDHNCLIILLVFGLENREISFNYEDKLLLLLYLL